MTPKITRLKARSAAIHDVTLSAGARLLYLKLDDMDWNAHGVAWPKHTTLAALLGFSARHIRRWMAELVQRGHIQIERKQRFCEYRLAWSDRTPVSYQEPSRVDTDVLSDRTPVSYHHLIYETREQKHICPACEDHGRTAAGDLCECPEGRIIAWRFANPRKGFDTPDWYRKRA